MRASHDSRCTLTALAVALALAASPAFADKPAFGPNDVPTVFFIDKSDDHNRVDYGLRLDAACQPAGKDALVPYWREFERSPPVRVHPLGWFEHVAYGIADQRLVRRGPAGAEYQARLKRLGRTLVIVTRREADGRCSAVAHALVAGVPGAVLDSAFVKLRRPMSVDYVEIHGRNPATGARLEERVRE